MIACVKNHAHRHKRIALLYWHACRYDTFIGFSSVIIILQNNLNRLLTRMISYTEREIKLYILLKLLISESPLYQIFSIILCWTLFQFDIIFSNLSISRTLFQFYIFLWYVLLEVVIWILIKCFKLTCDIIRLQYDFFPIKLW
jgi:hypothetical protein